MFGLGTQDFVIFAFGLGYQELLIFLVIAMLLFGSAKLPTLMRNLGKSATEFKKGLREEDADVDSDAPATKSS
jgi:sec-independent protein translocase protein TatA